MSKSTYQLAIAEYHGYKNSHYYPFWQGVKFRGGRLDLQRIFKTSQADWYHDAEIMGVVKVTPDYKAPKKQKHIGYVSMDTSTQKPTIGVCGKGQIGIKKVVLITKKEIVKKVVNNTWV